MFGYVLEELIINQCNFLELSWSKCEPVVTWIFFYSRYEKINFVHNIVWKLTGNQNWFRGIITKICFIFLFIGIISKLNSSIHGTNYITQVTSDAKTTSICFKETWIHNLESYFHHTSKHFCQHKKSYLTDPKLKSCLPNTLLYSFFFDKPHTLILLFIKLFKILLFLFAAKWNLFNGGIGTIVSWLLFSYLIQEPSFSSET